MIDRSPNLIGLCGINSLLFQTFKDISFKIREVQSPKDR